MAVVKDDDLKKNVNTIHSLVEIIKEINNEIEFLIKSSSEDFLTLHSNFAHIYKFITNLTGSIKAEIELFGNEDNRKFIYGIQKKVEDLKKEAGVTGSYIRKSCEIYNSLERGLDCLFIASNNFNQDLNTLKFLSANLKLDPAALHQSYALDGLIRLISESSSDFIYQTRLLLNEIKKSKNALQSLDNSYTDPIRSLVDNLVNIVDILRKKYKRCNDFRPVLHDMIKRSNENSSAIITQLKYQDIVKQKIEHVEQAHNDILKKLESITDLNKVDPSDITSFLIQVKDISELQASQLVYANKEYQTALQIINNKYLDLTDLVENILKMYQNTCSGKPGQEKYERTTDLRSLHPDVSGLIDTIDSIFTINVNSVTEKMHFFHEILKSQKKTCSKLTETISGYRINGDPSDHSYSINSQVYHVVSELEHNNSLLEDHISHCLTQVANISKMKKKMTRIVCLENETMNEYKNRFLNTGQNIPEVIKELPGDLIKAVQEVKYYDVFEHEIEKIIGRLNKIAGAIQVEVTLQETDSKNVELLRKRYTVGSEHTIHDQFSNSSDKSDKASAGNPGSDTGADGVELF